MKGKNLSRGLYKILSVLLSVLMIFSVLPAIALAEPGTAYTYQLVSNLTDGGIYVVCAKSGSTYYAMKNTINNGYASTSTSLTVSSNGNWITSAVDSSIQWTYASSGNTMKNGSNYLSRTSNTSNNLQLVSSAGSYGDWHLNSSKLYVNSTQHYLVLSTSNGFNASANNSYFGSTVYLFQQVSKTVSSISVNHAPTKTVYNEGEIFDPTGMVIRATYNDGSTEDISTSGSPDGYAFTPTGALSASDHSVSVSYGGQNATQAITVNAKTVTSIEITAPPTKTIYNEGETFDSAGMVVMAHYSNDTSATVTGYTVAPSGSLTPDIHSVTVTYNGQTATQNITVNALVLDHIAISTPPTKTAYIEGQLFNPAGMVITAYFTNNSHTPITTYTYSPNTNLKMTDTKITVSYGGQSVDQPITIAAKALDHIAITTPPTKTTYVAGQSFNPSGMVVKAYYTNDLNEEVTDYSFDPSGLAMGTMKVTVSYTYSGLTKSADQSITVIAKAIDHIAITTPPTKTAYVIGQTFDPSGMVVTAYYNDSTSEPITGFTTSPTRTLLTTDTKVTVSYSGKTVDQSITVTTATNAATPTINADTPVGWIAVDIGSTASLSVTASVSKGVLTYQWYSNTTNVNTGGTAVGTSSSDPTLPLNTAAASTTFYYCVVTNTDTTATGSQTATATSNVSEVIVRRDAQTPNIVSTSPANMSVYQNSSSSITVAAYIDSGALTYQWYSNTTGLNSGGTAVGTLSTSPTLTLNTSTAGTSYYYCVVTNTDYDAPGLKTATATSRAARVIVSAATSGTLLFTFDDGWADTYTEAYLKILKPAGFKATAYINSDFIDQHETGIMTVSQAQTLYNDGWDIGNHTTNHEDVGVGDQTDEAHMELLKAMYCNCATWLVNNNMPNGAYHAAYPSGLYTQDLIRLLKLNGFKTGRATIFGQQSAIQNQNDYFKLPVYSLGDTNDRDACIAGIDEAANTGTTIIIMIHKVEPYSGDLVTLNSWLSAVVNEAKTQVTANKLKVKTISDWYNDQGVVGSGETPPAPIVTGNDVTNTVTGLNMVMEYKLDNAPAYTLYDPTTFASVHLAGDHTLAVRYAAAGADPAGPDTVLTFTKVLQSITLTPPTKTAYVEGNTFDPTGMVVTAHYEDGTTAAVTGYTIDPTGALTTANTKVTISYTNAGITKTVDQPITVNTKKLASISITTEPTKKVYIEGTLFDPAGMVVSANYDNDTSEVITGYTTAPTGELKTTDTKVTVSYTYATVTKTADQPIMVNPKSLSSIAITTPPNKMTYIEGNSFDSTGMVVTAYYDNGKNEAVTGYSILPSGALATTDTKVTVSYGGKTADQPVTVNAKSLDHIGITTEPFMKVYVEGNAFSSTGMVVTAYYDNGTSEIVYGYSVAPLRALTTSDKVVTVSYTYVGVTKTVDQPITVHAKALTRIEITAPPTKTVYVEGNTFSTAGMVVTAFYDNDTSAVVTGYSFDPSGALAAADVKVTVSYSYVGITKTAEQLITVSAASLDHIGITTPPSKTIYIEGNTFDSTGMAVTAYYNNGTSAVVTGYSLSPSGELTITDAKVTVSYGGKSTDQIITVNAKKLSSIAITTQPNNKTYIEGNTFDSTGMVVTAYYNNGKHENVTGYTVAPSGALAITDTKVTVSYAFAGVTMTADQTITVNAKSLSRIAITTPPLKVTYIENNIFDSAGMVVTAYYDNGTSGVVTSYTVAPSGGLKTTDMKVTVSYGGMTAEQPITVLVASLDHIAITTPPSKTIYIEGNVFDNTDMVVTAYYNNGTSGVVTGYTIAPSGELAATDKKVTVTYGGKTADQAITVNTKKLTSIAITTQPNNKTYIEGNTFDPTGMAVTAYYDNGKNEVVTGYTFAPSGALAMTDTKVTVSYAFAGVTMTADQAITVNAKSLSRIAITTPPSKAIYLENNIFDPTGMVVTAYYDNGTNAVVTGYTFAPSGGLKTTDIKVIVNYGGKTAEQPITVLIASLDRIAITAQPNNKTYIEGNTFDNTGMVVTAYYNNGTSGVVTGYTITPSGELATTDTKVTVSYGGKTADQLITVNSKKLTSIAITTEPTRKTYIEGNTFDSSGMAVTAYYDNGKNEVITGYTVAPSGALATADKKVTVSYVFAGVTMTADQKITVNAKSLLSITISTPPTKTNYIEGNTFDTTGMVVSAYYDNGTNAAVTGYTVVPSGELKTTDTKVTVSYGGKTADQTITVAAKSLDHIVIANIPAKTQYVEGQAFDSKGMSVTAYYDNGTNGSVSGFTWKPDTALTTADTKVTVSFTYGGVTKTVDQAITVIAKAITSLDFKTHPTKVNYVEGETFDPTGMVLTATYNDGSSKDVLPGACTFSINRPLQVTDTSIVITFDTKNVTQDIKVSHTYTSNQLKNITATAGKLSPAFDPDVKSYTLLLDEHTAKTTIVPVLADASSKLYINGKKASSKTFTLATAKKTKVTIKVQPKTGKAVTYTVTIQRAASTNTSLVYLKASKGSLTKVDSAKYIVNLSSTQTKTALSLKLADKTAKYTMMLDGKKTKSKTVAMKPGQTRVFTIIVTPQAGSAYAMKYTVTIVRALS